MKTCTPCNGEGLVGQGPEPWLKMGKVDTCTNCEGTGQVDEESAQAEAAPAEMPAAENAPVDNAAADAPVPKDDTSSTGSEEAPQATEPEVPSDQTDTSVL